MNTLYFDFTNFLPMPQIVDGGTYKLKVKQSDLEERGLEIYDCEVILIGINFDDGFSLNPDDYDYEEDMPFIITEDDEYVYIEPKPYLYEDADGEYVIAFVFHEEIRPQLKESVDIKNDIVIPTEYITEHAKVIEPIKEKIDPVIPTTIINIIRGVEKQYVINNEDDIDSFFRNASVDVRYDIIETPRFSGAFGLKYVKVPEGVTNLSNYTFQENYNLYRVELPSTMKYVSGQCFYDCDNSIHELVCHGAPFYCEFYEDNWCMQDSFSSDSILYVPAEYMDAYENNENYSFFRGRIKPIINDEIVGVDDIVVLNKQIYSNETTLSFSYTFIGSEGTRYENLKGNVNIPINTTEETVTRTVEFENEYYNFEIEYTQLGIESKYATPFYIENITDNNGYVYFNNYSHPMLVSTNMNDWLTIDPYDESIELPANSRVYFKNPIDAGYFNTGNNYTSITVDYDDDDVLLNVGGNAMSLCYNNFTDKIEFTNSYNLCNLFYGNNNLINAEDLLLPATTLANSCYYYMFYGCSNLQTTPILPATTLTSNCYYQMFYGCNNISQIICLANDNGSIDNYGGELFSGIESNSRTFVKYEGANWNDIIPEGWTVEEFVPDEITDIVINPDDVIGSRTYTYYKAYATVNGHIEADGTQTGDVLTGIIFEFDGISNEFDANETDAIVEREVEITDPLIGNTYSTTINHYPDYKAIMFSHNGGTTIQPIYKVRNGNIRSAQKPSLEYSFDGVDWNTLDGDYEIDSSNVYQYQQLSGDVIFLRGTNPDGISSQDYQMMFDIYTPTSVSGDIMNLIDCNSTVTEIPCDSCFRNMFHSSYILTAPDLTAITLDTYCYFKMFYQSGLMKSPALPATTLADGCYNQMFQGCTSLTTAPALPATTLANSCYISMFYNCSNLATAPELPATTLASSCYSEMFGGCSSLTTAPALPATTLASSCYYYMFYNCTKLNYIKMMADNISAYNCLYYWVSGVASTGTFVKSPDATWDVTGASGVPEGWMVEYDMTPTKVENIQWGTPVYANQNSVKVSYTLVDENSGKSASTYTITNIGENTTGATRTVQVSITNSGFTFNVSIEQNNEVSYIVIPFYFENPNDTNITLTKYYWNYTYGHEIEYSYDNVTWTYYGPIYSGDSFTIQPHQKLYFRAKANSANYLFSGNNQNQKFASTGNVNVGGNVMSFIHKDYMDMKTISQSYCFASLLFGMTNLKDASNLVLPATTLASYCYQSMFYNCSSLTTAPETLPATTLTSYCYQQMFYQCTSLATAPALPATTLADYCYQLMFYECTSLATAPELPATTLAYSCYQLMFSGCSSLTTAPETLPATTLTSYCYSQMFQNCTSLATAPELPATTLENSCYNTMFVNCSSLNYIKAMFTTTPSGSYTNGWVFGVAGTGTFVKSLDATWDVTGVNGIPEGWTIEYEPSDLKSYDSIEILSALPETIYANVSTVTGTIQVNYMSTSDESKSYNMKWKSNDFGKNTTGEDRSVEITFEYKGKTVSRTATQNTIIPAMYFENTSDSSITIGVRNSNSSAYTAALQTSTDNESWEDWGTTSTTALTRTVPAGGRLYIKAAANPGYFNNHPGYYNYFTSTGNVNVGGNIMSLGYSDFEGQTTITTNYSYNHLFDNMTNLKDASELVLPATILASWCYNYMFFYCSSLTTAPELPATTLASWCYQSMFSGCSSLTTAPELPATTLANNCYYQMFYGCSKLTTAPELPATTLANSCYYGMFQVCASLATAPVLPATTLALECYMGMFQNCSSLTTAPELPATTLANNCYSQMFQNCTRLTTAPELPATTLVSACYSSMFSGCSSLTTVPELPATTLATSCYGYMFYNCTSLNYIKAMFTTTPSSSYTNSWVSGVASTGTFVKNANATWNVTGANGIPTGWTVQTASE